VKADVLPMDGAEHQAVQLLLPWHGNGMLSDAELAQVEAHLASCARCRADLAWQARLRGARPEQATLAQAPAVDRGWAALRAQIAAPDDTPAPRVPRKLGTALPWWPIALALQSSLLVLVSLAFAWSMFAPRGEPYRALGTGAPDSAANALVVFRPEATQAQMRDALRAGDARIVGGPTVTDAYLLHLNATGRDALARLRAQPGVLRIEALDAEAAR